MSDVKGDQTQSINESPIKISAICMSPVELPYVSILLDDTFTKALWDTGAEKSFISKETYQKYFFYKQVKKSSTQVITAQGAKCQNIGVVELNIRIREFERPWLFHVLANLEYPCILGIDFIGGSKIILDFDRKSLAIPDSQINKVVKTVEIEKVEIDLFKTKLEENRNGNYKICLIVFKDCFRINQGLRMFYIMRLTREITHQLFPGRKGIMSAPDLRSGYFQMAVNPSDIVKTAFVTKNGTYAFRRMPFSLSGAAPNFQKTIDIILKPVIGKLVNVYMDDVIISSPSFTQHVEHLEEVFRLLHEAGLTLNKDKCKFGCEELKYLGLIINKEGIKTDESKVQAIIEMKPPRNSKEVSKFLGMSQWYTKFIKNYADLCEPLFIILNEN
ncbi:retrovirus-related Pol polyprotein from transposon opus [Trichonephila clavipes]|nr:retrovirus-related Pol polyprotein from transposon opus [Trichonephila clavipes]